MAVVNKFKIVLKSVAELLKDQKNMAVFLISFISIAMVLQWAFQYQVLWNIFTNKGLNIGEKVQEVFQAFINLFILIDDITPVSILLVSLVQGLVATMLIAMKNIKGKVKSLSSTSVALVGIGCVSCGGSLLSPLLATVASNISLTLAQSIGNVVLLVSLVLSYNLLSKVALQYAGYKKII